MASDGGFVIIWTSSSADGDGAGIAARRVDASGNPIGGEFVVNSSTTGFQVNPAIAVAANGSFVAVWQDSPSNNGDGSGSAIFGQRYDASGTRLGGEFLVNTYTPGVQRYPSISMSPGADFVVAWIGPGDGAGSGTFARRFDGSGNPLGNDFVVNSFTPGVHYATGRNVVHDARGNFVISWSRCYGYSYCGGLSSFAQRFSASGTRRGAEFRITGYTTGYPSMPSLASDSVGNFIVAWNDSDGSSGGVFARRFGGLAATALTVDSGPGNLVWEPGETVTVRPSWRNSNGAAQTFGGTLTDITGPTGAAYTITDGVGDYGTVADGATAPCTDCYAVSVSNPPVRPALHWDASAVESILPDTQGQQKEWRLHIGASFTDVSPASPFYRFTETLLHHDVTAGCGADTYCPASTTTREQMAVFVLVAREGGQYLPAACGATPMFADVPQSSPFCRWVEELARRGVVTGCGGGNYCPTDAVTREQMAVFVLLTLDPALSPPACTTPIYGDVPATSPFCRWVEELTRRGVVTGCGGGNYCPASGVTREQMSVFLAVTFDLTLYGV
jgi:hypothetical protein